MIAKCCLDKYNGNILRRQEKSENKDKKMLRVRYKATERLTYCASFNIFSIRKKKKQSANN